MLQETKIHINESDLLTLLSVYEEQLDQRRRNYNERTGQEISLAEYANRFEVAGWEEYRRLNDAWWRMESDKDYTLFEQI